MSEVNRYVLDYYIKGLDAFAQRSIWQQVADRISGRDCEMLIDGENGFENVFKTGVYKDRNDIEPFLKLQKMRFDVANKMMRENKRFPLFEDTNDLIASAKQRNKLVKYMPESECNKVVGCESFQSYIPKVYEPTEKEKQK